MGLGDFMDGIGDAVTNVAKGVGYVANPTHWDNIAEGAGKAAEFAIENPGKTAHIIGEVGKAVVKDQLDPVNLAINAGLIAATVATGGAAAPAFFAKMGLGTKSAEVGISAMKGADTAVDVVKGVDTATDVAKAAQSGSKAARLVDKALGTNPGKFGQTVNKVLNPLENSKFGIGALREKGAAKLLEAGGEAPGLMRQVGAAVLQGSGRGAGAPTQLAGISDDVYRAQKMGWRAQQAQKRVNTLQNVGTGVEVAADPAGAVRKQAYKEMDRRGVGQDSGYSDRGQTVESLYGDTEDGVDMYGRQGGGVQRQQHAWEGPGRQWLGGISSSYDWRKMEPLRPIQATRSRTSQRTSQSTTGSALNEQGAPVNFSPEIPDSGMFSMSKGQVPQTGIDDSGQGYFNFGNEQPGLGKQPNTWDVEAKGLLPEGPKPSSIYDASSVYDSPAYSPSRTRTQRRVVGMNPVAQSRIGQELGSFAKQM